MGARGFVVKPDRDVDFYIIWSNIVEAPLGYGNREDLLADGIDADRIYRADVTGTSMMRDVVFAPTYWGVLDGEWEDEGFVAEQRGVLPRASLAAYAVAYFEERWDDAWDLLTPFDDETPVRREPVEGW